MRGDSPGPEPGAALLAEAKPGEMERLSGLPHRFPAPSPPADSPMSSKDDVQFLALLVHRGHLARSDAEKLMPALQAGEALDDLLLDTIGWDEEFLDKMRRTQAGEIPEIPGYEVLGKVGTGGTADVFRVREKKTSRAIAIKVLKPEATRHAPTRKAFIGEARLLESLEHVGLVRGFGVAKSGTTYFNRLELIEGRTLLEYLDEGQAFEESVALRIILETAEVLKYLYSRQVVHRDIKPGNIMLTQNGSVKLIDLGFAAEGGQVSNPEDSAVGTVAYLSPEQARGGAAADLRSDVYSLGVTLFQLVVGRLPFESSDDQEILRMQVMESLSSPELKSRGFTPHLSYFIEKMMAKELEVRYQTWDDLIEDIKEQLAGFESLDYAKNAKVRRTRGTRGPRGRR